MTVETGNARALYLVGNRLQAWHHGRMGDAHQQKTEHEIAVDLVQRIRAGDPSAEAEMCERYSRGLLMVLRQRTKDEQLSLDLRQDAFIVAIEKLRAGVIESPDKLSSWLIGVALGLWRNSQKKMIRRKTDMRDDLEETIKDIRAEPGSLLSQAQVSAIVRLMLDEMPTERDREVLIRIYLYDQDREEVRQALGMTDDKGKAHFNRVVHRARRRLRDLLAAADRRYNLNLVKT